MALIRCNAFSVCTIKIANRFTFAGGPRFKRIFFETLAFIGGNAFAKNTTQFTIWHAQIEQIIVIVIFIAGALIWGYTFSIRAICFTNWNALIMVGIPLIIIIAFTIIRRNAFTVLTRRITHWIAYAYTETQKVTYNNNYNML